MRDLKNMEDVQAPSRWMRVRVRLVGLVFFACLAGLFWRAVNLQVQQEARLKGMAEDQYVREMNIPAKRGDIFDRRGVPLAQSIDVDSVWIDPSEHDELKPVAKQLAKALGVDQSELLERLQKGHRFAWVKRQVTPAEVARVKALELKGIGFAKEPRRFYPQRELAAHVIGLVGTDDHGLDGLELAFEEELSGDQVKREGYRDAKGRKLLTNGVDDKAGRAGATVTLAIDHQLQYVTEKALLKAVDDSKATAGMVVMLDPKTGEILALANAPRFNPNAPQGTSKEAFRDRAITDTFEPGSTFKSFVVAAALDKKVISEETEVETEGGAWAIGKHVIHDTHSHGTLNARQVLQVSSNIGAAKIGNKLGREGLVEAFQKFGFGEKVGVGAPGEGKGVVPFPKADIQLATESFGQGLTATALQVAAGYAALANKGVLMKPTLVSKVVDADGVVLLENQPTVVRRVVSEQTAQRVVSMLETVVEKDGTAPRARMDEYRVAGKTGTAQKADPVTHGYSEKRVASFVGMVPAEDPRLVVLVVIDEPKTDVYGGLSAAPAFKEIAGQALAYLGVPPSRTSGHPELVEGSRTPKTPLAARPSVPEKPVAALERDVVSDVVEGAVRVPELSGLAGRTAVAQLLGASLLPRLAGSGRVVAQHPAAGSLVDKGSAVTLELAGRLPASP